MMPPIHSWVLAMALAASVLTIWHGDLLWLRVTCAAVTFVLFTAEWHTLFAYMRDARERECRREVKDE